MTPELRQTIRQAYSDGMSQRAISILYGIPKSTIGDNVRGARKTVVRILYGDHKGKIAKVVRYSDYISGTTGATIRPSLRYVELEGIGYVLERWTQPA